MASRPDPTLAEPSVHEPNNLASHLFAKLVELLLLLGRRTTNLDFQPPCNWLRRKSGVFPGWIVTEVVPNVVTNDPVVEIVVRNNVNSSNSHRPVAQRTGDGFDELTTAP